MSRFPRESVVMTKHSDWLERGGRRVCHVFCRREEGPAKNSKRAHLFFDGLGTTTEAHEALVTRYSHLSNKHTVNANRYPLHELFRFFI